MLFTDGLVESRTLLLPDGLARLLQVVDHRAGDEGPLHGLCEGIVSSMVPGRTKDDIAILAARVRAPWQRR